jgi:SAM-dependent methyltransferase
MWNPQTTLKRAVFLKALLDKSYPGGSPRDKMLDIGAGDGVMAEVFGAGFNEVYTIDLKTPSPRSEGPVVRGAPTLQWLRASGDALPFPSDSFDLVTAFSVLEHMPPDRARAVDEWIRVLKPGGVLLIQIPNRYFVIELHSGLPNPNYMPRAVRERLLNLIGYGWMKDVDIPSLRLLRQLIWRADPSLSVSLIPLKWPITLVPRRLRLIYRVLDRLRWFALNPFGYMAICDKPPL